MSVSSGGAVERRPRWRVVTAGGAALEVDAVICALPAYRAAPLFEPHSPPLARALADDQLCVGGGGQPRRIAKAIFRARREVSVSSVPAIERRRIIAGSFTSLKFDGRAPAGTILVRAFVGGAMQSELMALDDAAMIEVVREEFRALLGAEAAPLWSQVNRWPDSMPQYAVGHHGAWRKSSARRPRCRGSRSRARRFAA